MSAPRDAEFNKIENWKLQAILTLDYRRRVWDLLSEEQKIERGRKARDENRDRLAEGRN